MPRRIPPRPCAVALLAACGVARAGGAQASTAGDAHGPAWGIGAQAIPVVTRVAPAFAGADYTEGYLTQPVLMGHLGTAGGGLSVVTTLDFEGITLARGELTSGIFGEGYVDRRHPHTYLHEAVASGVTTVGGAALSLSLGRGFAPFGTDDPMMRPFVKYPANHHLAQILERVLVAGAARVGPLLLEGAAFNGDEPVSPGAAPRWRRFGDSWSGRATLAPRHGVELQGSVARVESPELAAGGGTDQRKASGSLRVARAAAARGAWRYALVEWARTAEYASGRRSFVFASWLGEGTARWRATDVSARLERTTRPEEERLLDPFRSARPHTDASISGTTRFTTATVNVSRPVALGRGRLRAAPFVEVSRARAAQASAPSAFVPAAFYGSDRIWTGTAGVVLGAGMPRDAHRMGRYGAARAGPHAHRPSSGTAGPRPAHQHDPAPR